MPKTLFLLLLALLLTLGAAAATPILILPSEVSVSGNLGEQITTSFTVQNVGTVEAVNFSVAPLSSFTFPLVNIPPNGTVTYTFTTRSFQPILTPLTSVASFVYAINTTPAPVTVNVTFSPFSPADVTIRQDDAVAFVNRNNRSMQISTTNALFTRNVSMNDVYVHQFTTTGDVIVFDEFGQAGFIHVVNRSDVLYVRNPAFDRTLTFRMNIRSQVSNLVLTIFEPNVTVAFNGDKETALSIRNNDNIGALRLTVNDSLGWTFFPQNTITLNPAEERVLIYRIRPRITATGQTNQTHVLTITAQGENTVAVTRTVSVFVPFQNLTGTSVENLNLTREQLQAELEAAIARFTALRDSLAGGTNATSIIFLERNQTLALTGEQLNALALALPSLKESVDRLLGDRQTVIENVNSQIAQANTNSATALELTKTLESALKNMQSWRAFTIVLGSVLLLEGGLLYGIWHYRRRSTKEKLVKL